jgi:hypothetical protein
MMDCQIPENKLSKFRPQVKEDEVYYIKHFQVLPARKVYPQVDSPYIARFTAFTKVYRVNTCRPYFRSMHMPLFHSVCSIHAPVSGNSHQVHSVLLFID